MHLMSTMHIEEKIAWAKNQFLRWRPLLFSDGELMRLLKAFGKAKDASHKVMVQAGVVDICRRCEMEEGGSCCGAGIEGHYDEWLLLINLMLGVDLPKRRWREDSCFFLSNKGCLLSARHTICINYLCRKITEQIDAKSIALLREREGRELELLFLLNERLKMVVKARGSGDRRNTKENRSVL